jgi:protein-glucosylgalactosylhydroxylysine glucosidase
MKKQLNYLLLFVFFILVSCRNNSKVDRYQQVNGFNIYNSLIDSMNSLSVGNGEFTFSVDITGLQTFPEFYSHGIPLVTMADWSTEKKENHKNNYHNHLGTIGLQVLKENGKEISVNDIKDPVQKLNLWTWEIDSRFSIEGVPVHLMTVCHSDYDMISVKIISSLIGRKRLRIKIDFSTEIFSPPENDSNATSQNATRILSDTNNVVIFNRSHDIDNYYALLWRNDADLKEVTQHLYYLKPSRADSVYSFSFQFLDNLENGRIQNFGETSAASSKNWEKFWTTTDDLHFSNDTGPKSKEHERQILFSKYLSRIKY